MKKWVHQAYGVGVSAVSFQAGMPLELSLGVFIGSTAPDWLELPVWRNGERSSVIPHRTITHWMSLWFVVLALLAVLPAVPITNFGQGFCVGVLLHICLDAVTPMGVPIFVARRRLPVPVSAAVMIVVVTAIGLGQA